MLRTVPYLSKLLESKKVPYTALNNLVQISYGQWIGQKVPKPQVADSNPSIGYIFFPIYTGNYTKINLFPKEIGTTWYPPYKIDR